jgi:hypothetical protein
MFKGSTLISEIMKRRSLLTLCLTAALIKADGSSAQEPAKNAIVTFYSHGSRITSGLPGTKSVFWGKIFDDKKLLFSFREGFIHKNNLVISLTLQPGAHTFLASYATMPTHAGKLSLTLEPGKTYFVRAESTSEGVVVVEFEKGRLDQVPCDTARKETQGAELLSGKKVSPQMNGNVVPTTLPITCP